MKLRADLTRIEEWESRRVLRIIFPGIMRFGVESVIMFVLHYAGN